MADDPLTQPQEQFGEQPSPGLPSAAPAAPATDGGAKIRAKSADGVVHQFPAGTPQDVVDTAMKSYAEEHADKTTTLGQMGRGFMDPLEGGGQLLSELTPAPIRETINQFNNWVSQKTGGLISELPPGGKSQQVREREAAIEQERGLAKENTDWTRMAGNVLNPVNYIGGGGLGGANKLFNVGRAMGGGAFSGAISPAADPSFWTEKVKQTTIGSAFGLGIGLVTGAVSKGLDKVGESIIRNHPEWLENEAVRTIVRRMSQDAKAGAPTATDMVDMVNAGSGPWAGAGAKPMTLTDVAQPKGNVRSLAGSVARKDEDARAIAASLLTKRDEQAAHRISADIDNFVHGGQTAHEATESLLTARSAASTPAYDAMHELQGVWSPRLQQFLEDPAIKQGMSEGFKLERMLSLAEGRPLSTTQLGVDLSIDGSVKMLGTPNMRLLDMGKRGLDAMIAAQRNAITGRLSAEGVALDKVRKAYVSELDNLDTKGLYKKAREAWAGYSASMDSIKLGRAVFGMHPEEISGEVAKMSPANREFYRMGVADVMKERLAKVGLHGDEAKAIVKNSWMRDQLKPAFREAGDYDKFVDAVTKETRMFETGVELKGGSASADRIAEDVGGNVDKALQAARVVGKFASWHPVQAAVEAWRLYRDLGIKANPELNEKIAQILFATELPVELGAKLTGKASTMLPNPMDKAAQGISRAGVMGGETGGISSTHTKPEDKKRSVLLQNSSVSP